MRKRIKTALVTVLSAALLLNCIAPAWATDPASGTSLSPASGTSLPASGSGISRDGDSSYTTGGTSAGSGIAEFNLIKDYDSFNPTWEAPNSSSPAEIFTYTITPYGVWNAGTIAANTNKAIDKDNMPMLNTSTPTSMAGSSLTVNQKVEIGQARYEGSDNYTQDQKTTIFLPEYRTVGDYWYEIKETIGVNAQPTTGVIYGTNDAQPENLASRNGGHNATYYLHVQVTETKTAASDTSLSATVRNVTLHKTAPVSTWTNLVYNSSGGENANYVAGNKVNAIENRYYAGDLVIKKIVTGNGGDKSRYFPVTVVFTKPEGTIVNSDITFSAALLNSGTYANQNVTIKGQYSNDAASDTVIRWKQGATDTDAASDYYGETKATAVFCVKDYTTVTFSNIPYGIEYTVREELPPDDNYENKLEFTSKDGAVTFNNKSLATDSDVPNLSADDKTAKGSISDARDEITITNNKEVQIDIGVVIEDLPFIVLLAVSGAALVLLLARKRQASEV